MLVCVDAVVCVHVLAHVCWGGDAWEKILEQNSVSKKSIIYPVLLSFTPWGRELTMQMKAPALDKLRQMTTGLKVTPTSRPVNGSESAR